MVDCPPLYWTIAMDSYLEQLLRELEETMSVTSRERMENGPPGKWTPEQILEHLFLTYHNTNKGLANVWRTGRRWGRARPCDIG